MSVNNKKDEPSIKKSVEAYQKIILDDINLTLRVITKDKTYVTKLIDWKGERFIFSAPLDKLDWVLFERDKVVEMVFVTKGAMFSAQVQILNRYRKKEVLFYSATLLSPLIKKQQRQYFRLDVLLEVNYRVLPKEDETYDLDELPLLKGTSVNISMGGLCLVGEQQLYKGETLLMNFDFMNTQIELMGEVLLNGEKNAAGNYSHRIKFNDTDVSTQNLLNKLIFEKQRLLMSKNKESLI